MTKTEERNLNVEKFTKSVEKYLKLKKNETPDPKYCPTVYIAWSTSKTTNCKNLQTGKFIKNLDEKNRVYQLPDWKRTWREAASPTNEFRTRPNSFAFCRYVKPDYNLGIIEFSSVTIDTKRTNGPTPFKFLGSRVFMSMDDMRIWGVRQYTEQLEIIKPTDYVHRVPQGYYRDWWYSQLKLKTYLTDGKAACNEYVRNELYKYLQYKNITTYFNGKQEKDISQLENFSIWNFAEMLTAKKQTQKNIDKEALIKRFLNTAFEDVELTEKDLCKHSDRDGLYYYGVIKYEKFEDYDVFRFFDPYVSKKSTYSSYTYQQSVRGINLRKNCITEDELSTLIWEEVYRLFCKDGKLYILDRGYWANHGKFSYVTAPNALKYVKGDRYRLLDVKKVKNLGMFKYISDQIQEYNNDFVQHIITTRKPIIEQLIKINCPKIAAVVSSENQIAANLKEYVGAVNAKGKTLKEIFGMTTKQLQYIESLIDRSPANYYWSTNDASLSMYDIPFIYEIFSNKPSHCSKNDVSDMDLETFKDITGLILNLKNSNNLQRSWNWRWRPDELMYGPTFQNLCPDNIEPENRYRYLKKMINMCSKVNLNIGVIGDNARMFNQLTPEFKPQNMTLEYKCPSDISRIHDALVELLNQQRAEQARINALKADEKNRELEKKMKKLDEKRRELEYEDDTYLIRIPKKLSELTVEGTTQRICIGSYLNYHAEGRTNIYFLRKKSDPDKPFFAIEEKNGRIIQIHGYGNKWLGADDDSFAAVPFVMKWLHKHGISCDNQILTAKSSGYGCGSEFRTLPTVNYEEG